MFKAKLKNSSLVPEFPITLSAAKMPTEGIVPVLAKAGR